MAREFLVSLASELDEKGENPDIDPMRKIYSPGNKSVRKL
jgi:hypothetical protein